MSRRAYYPSRGRDTVVSGLLAFAVYVLLTAVLLGAIAFAVVTGAKLAGASENDRGRFALETEYHSAPGHGPSLSAYCATTGIVVGYHPWDHGHRNFQVWQGLVLLVNTNDPDQTFEVPFGDYVIRYVAQDYIVRGDLCTDTQSTTTTEPSTTTTSEEPTTTTSTTASSSTSTTAQTTTSTTTPAESSSTSVSSTSTTEPEIILTSATTPGPSTELSTTTTSPSTSELPYTGARTWRLVVAAALLVLLGATLVAVATSSKNRPFKAGD